MECEKGMPGGAALTGPTNPLRTPLRGQQNLYLSRPGKALPTPGKHHREKG